MENWIPTLRLARGRDSDQSDPEEQSEQGLHCLLVVQVHMVNSNSKFHVENQHIRCLVQENYV